MEKIFIYVVGKRIIAIALGVFILLAVDMAMGLSSLVIGTSLIYENLDDLRELKQLGLHIEEGPFVLSLIILIAWGFGEALFLFFDMMEVSRARDFGRIFAWIAKGAEPVGWIKGLATKPLGRLPQWPNAYEELVWALKEARFSSEPIVDWSEPVWRRFRDIAEMHCMQEKYIWNDIAKWRGRKYLSISFAGIIGGISGSIVLLKNIAGPTNLIVLIKFSAFLAGLPLVLFFYKLSIFFLIREVYGISHGFTMLMNRNRKSTESSDTQDIHD